VAEYPGAGGSGGGGVVNTGQFITTGRRPVKPGAESALGIDSVASFTQTPQMVSIQDILAAYSPAALWQQGRIKEAVANEKLAQMAGFSSFEDAIAAAANDPNKGSRSWRDYLVWMAGEIKAAGIDLSGGGGGGGGGGPYSYSDTSIQLSSESEAAAIADSAWQEQLGRQAQDGELEQFHQDLNRMQRQNPTKSVTTGVASGNSRTSTTRTKGGFDPRMYAVQYAQSRDDYAENFAATTFMRLLDRAIEAPNAVDDLIGGGE
jgi:hypothetical protein